MTKPIEATQGQWQAVSAILAGNSMPEGIVAATKLKIVGNSYEVDLDGTIDAGSCSIWGDAPPFRMSISGKSGPNAGKSILAIVEFLDNETMRIAYDLSGTSFPDLFDPIAYQDNYVATFKRLEQTSRAK